MMDKEAMVTARATEPTHQMQPVKILVPLLNEGTDVWRPANAKAHSEDVFEILGIIPVGEEWQFAPGTRVRCRPKQFADGSAALVAYELVVDQP
jgi:hypothetical protein